MDGGSVGSADYEEIAVATYSGRVMGLTREPVQRQPISQEVQAKLTALKYVLYVVVYNYELACWSLQNATYTKLQQGYLPKSIQTQG